MKNNESYLAFKIVLKKKQLLQAFLENRGITQKDFFNSFVDYSLKILKKEGLWDRGPYTTMPNGKRMYIWEGEERLRKFEARNHKKIVKTYQ